MGFIDRIRSAASVMAGRAVAVAGWQYRGGTKSGVLFDGSKFRGALARPSAFDLDVCALRERARRAHWDSPQASCLLGRLADNVIGTGMTLECSPVWDLVGAMGKSEDERRAMCREIEWRFYLYMKSRELDATGKLSGLELQGFEFINRMRDGETIVVMRYNDDARRMSPLSVQFVMPEQVAEVYDASLVAAAKARGNKIVDGFELDSVGREVAIYVRDEETQATTRIPFYGARRRFVLHPIVADMIGAVRGSPLLGNVLHELTKIADGTVAELEAMVLNAVIAVWIEPSPDAPSSKALAGIARRTPETVTQEAQQADSGPSVTKIDNSGIIVQSLKAGEKVNSFDTKRPNTNFATFTREITKTLAASKGVPIEVLEQSFNANYSASRAALLLFWNAVERWREVEASQFLGPIYEAWFAEEVRLGRIRAPNFNDSPIIRAAWLNCLWIGKRLPSLDPLKEASADEARIQQGATTRERNALDFNGSDYWDNVARLEGENAALAKAGGQAMSAPSSTQDGEDNDETEGGDDVD